MGIPTDNFALQVPSTTLGYNPNTSFTSVTATYINTTDAGTLNPFNVYTPTTSLGYNPVTVFTAINGSDIKNITNGTIPSFNIYIPTTSLGYNPNNPFTSISNNSIIVIGSAGYLPNWGTQVPSVPIGGQFSTFIYTSNTTITSIGGTAATPTQTWYMS